MFFKRHRNHATLPALSIPQPSKYINKQVKQQKRGNWLSGGPVRHSVAQAKELQHSSSYIEIGRCSIAGGTYMSLLGAWTWCECNVEDILYIYRYICQFL